MEGVKAMQKEFEVNKMGSFYNESANFSDFMTKYCSYLNELLMGMDMGKVDEAVKCIYEARKRGATIFFAGNGGSAATASHFATDLSEIGKKTKTKNFRALSLTDNSSFITALGNDYGYDKVFTGQMMNLFSKGDVLLAISASGNSPNVIEAVKMAKEMGGTTIGFAGFDGGKLAELCDHTVHIRTNKGEYGPVEDIHLVLDHIITQYLTCHIRALEKQTL